MKDELYTVLALGMRYWFTLLGVLIVWRAFHWLRRDRHEKHRRLRQLPDAGMVGEFVSLNDAGDMTVDDTLPVPREGVLGKLYSCDVPVLCDGVAKYHLDLVYEDGLGLRVKPRRGLTCRINGEELTRAGAARNGVLVHGDVLQVGDAALRLRLFAGLKFKRPARKGAESRGRERTADEPITPASGWQPSRYDGFSDPAWGENPADAFQDEGEAPQKKRKSGAKGAKSARSAKNSEGGERA